MDGIWLAFVREKLNKTKQIQYFKKKLLKILIMDENMETSMENATLKVSIFL